MRDQTTFHSPFVRRWVYSIAKRRGFKARFDFNWKNGVARGIFRALRYIGVNPLLVFLLTPFPPSLQPLFLISPLVRSWSRNQHMYVRR